MLKEKPKHSRIQTESKVLHVRALPWYVTEQEIVDIIKKFGDVQKVLILPDKNQAFVEMHNAAQAADVLAGLEYSHPTIRHKRVYWQYSDRERVEAKSAVCVADNRVTGETQGSVDPVGPTVILLAISNVTISVTLEALQQIGSAYGTIYRIITFNKGSDFHALLEFSSSAQAVAAKEALDGKDLYENCCHIRASYSNKHSLQVKTNDYRSWDYTLLMPANIIPFAFYGMEVKNSAGFDPHAYQQFPQHQPQLSQLASARSASSSTSFLAADASPTRTSTASSMCKSLASSFVSTQNRPDSSSIVSHDALSLSNIIEVPSFAAVAAGSPVPLSSALIFSSNPVLTSGTSSSAANVTSSSNALNFPRTQSPITSSYLPPYISLRMIDCFGSQPFQGHTTAAVYLENSKIFDDHTFLTQVTSELNVLVILITKSPTFSPNQPDFSLCWLSPNWDEGEDPHAISAAISASHLLFGSRITSHSANLLPRFGNHRSIIAREEVGVSRVIWLTIKLSLLDVFAADPWYSSEDEHRIQGLTFVQGLKLDANRVVSVERNGNGVVIIHVSDETSVLQFATKFLPPTPECARVLVVTAGCSSRHWQQDAFDSTSRVFVVDPFPPFALHEDCGGGAGSIALACYWYPRTNKVASAFRNPSSRPGVICTRLQQGAFVGMLPFDSVEIGGQAVTTMEGVLTI